MPVSDPMPCKVCGRYYCQGHGGEGVMSIKKVGKDYPLCTVGICREKWRLEKGITHREAVHFKQLMNELVDFLKGHGYCLTDIDDFDQLRAVLSLTLFDKIGGRRKILAARKKMRALVRAVRDAGIEIIYDDDGKPLDSRKMLS